MATATVPLKLSEVAALHSDVKQALMDAINDHATDKGGSHKDDAYIDHDGDGSEGNVIYCCKGNTCQSPYEMGAIKGKAPTAQIDFATKKNVLPVTQYLPEPEDEDHYTAMDEAFRKDKLYTELPVYERFISQKTRDAADTGDLPGRADPFLFLSLPTSRPHCIRLAAPDQATIRAMRCDLASRASPSAKAFRFPTLSRTAKTRAATRAAKASNWLRPRRSPKARSSLRLRQSIRSSRSFPQAAARPATTPRRCSSGTARRSSSAAR